MLEIKIRVDDEESRTERIGEEVTNGQIVYCIKTLEKVKAELMEALKKDINLLIEDENKTELIIKNMLESADLEEKSYD